MEHIETAEIELKDLWENPEERQLALDACNYYLTSVLKPSYAEVYLGWSDPLKMNLFRWARYVECRRWLIGYKALSCSLVLRKAWKPWEVEKKS